MWQLMRMTVVTYSSLLVTPVIGLLLCTPKYLMGTMSLGEVVQAAAAFVVVQTAFNWFTDNYAKLAEWASSANRVASLLLALDEVDRAGADQRPRRLPLSPQHRDHAVGEGQAFGHHGDEIGQQLLAEQPGFRS